MPRLRFETAKQANGYQKKRVLQILKRLIAFCQMTIIPFSLPAPLTC